MALVVKDRVKETTTTTGTGTLTLAGATVGFQSFSVIGNGNTTYYAITDGTNWEVGIGTYTSSGTLLSRDTILESSNGGAAVNWGAGSKDVFVTYPAEKSVDSNGTGASGTWAISITGNAASATQVYVTESPDDNVTYMIPYTSPTGSAGGNRSLYTDNGGLSFNPGTNVLACATFQGSLSGNASSATQLQTTRTINNTSFNGTANIITANWGTSRTLTIGSTGKSVNGSTNVSWTLTEIGALAYVAPGTSGNVLTSNGSTWISAAPPAGGGVNSQVFTTSSTFTIPAGVTKVKVTVVGGGGGGNRGEFSSCTGLDGGGGGGGATAFKWLTGLTPGNTIGVTVGAGGNGRTNLVAVQSGGSSSIQSGTQTITTVTAGGGGAGALAGGAPSSGGAGGTATNGDINIPGGGANLYVGGHSASFSSVSRVDTFNIAGAAGGVYGNGGNGGRGGSTIQQPAGGNGGAGIVIFEW